MSVTRVISILCLLPLTTYLYRRSVTRSAVQSTSQPVGTPEEASERTPLLSGETQTSSGEPTTTQTLPPQSQSPLSAAQELFVTRASFLISGLGSIFLPISRTAGQVAICKNLLSQCVCPSISKIPCFSGRIHCSRISSNTFPSISDYTSRTTLRTRSYNGWHPHH